MAAEWEGTISSPRRVLLPAVLLALGLVVGLVAVPADQRPEFSVIPGNAQVPPLPAGGQTATDFGGSWAPVDDGPLRQRKGPAMVWTGREVLVWGGVSANGAGLRDGAAYNPDSDQWRHLPPAPIRGRLDAVVSWSGDELLVWGGGADGEVSAGGAAFDPRANRWRRLPPGPLRPRRNAEAAWTGTQLIVWGGDDGDTVHFDDGARYNPVTDRWRRLPPGPLARGTNQDVELVAADGGVLVWSSSGSTARTVFYETATNRWRELWTPRFQPATHPTFLATDGAVLSWGWASIGDHGPLALKFTTDPDWWTTVARPPVAPDAGRSLLGSDGVAVSWTRAGTGIWYDALSDEWHRMTPSPRPVAAGWAEQVWTDDRLVVWHAEARRGAAHRAVVWRPTSSWQTLPSQPVPVEGDVSAAWTGWLQADQQAVVWGGTGATTGAAGQATPGNAGAVYDPSLARWEAMPAAPLPPRTGQATAWTGDELVVLGGLSAGGEPLTDGAAYNPLARAWRTLPPAPVATSGDGATLGGRYVYAAGRHPSGLRVARYDHRRDRWRVLPRPPLPGGVTSATLWWTGREVWLWWVRGGTARGAAWDPAAESWRWLPALHGLNGRASMAPGWRRLFVMDGAGITASLGLGTDGWRLHPLGPAFGAPPALSWAGRSLVAYDPEDRRLATLDPRAAAWAELPPPPVPADTSARLLWTGRHLLVFSAGAAASLGS